MKVRLYIIVLITVVLSSCDFFYSTVEYKGKESEPHLCVLSQFNAAQTEQRIYVSHSEFFLRTETNDLPYVSDAIVQVQVNNNPAVKAEYVPYSSSTVVKDENGAWNYSNAQGGYYAVNVPVTASDKVSLHVEHPTYGKAEAEQISPDSQPAQIKVDSVSRYGEVYGQLTLPAYRGAEDDVLTILCRIDSCVARLTIEQKGRTFTDTIRVRKDDQWAAVIYSQNELFGRLDNYQTPLGYYGGWALDAPVTKEQQNVPFIVDMHVAMIDGCTLEIDSLTFTIITNVRTQDDYKYFASADRVTGRSLYVSELSSQRTSQDQEEDDISIEELMYNIGTMFDVLGNAESNQLYSNLTGIKNMEPIGFFSITHTSETTYKLK